MKKKLILLPLLMLALGACGSSVVASSTPVTTSEETTSSETSTTSETTSEAPVADTNVYRIVGSVQETAWTVDGDEFLMVKDAEENIFTVEGIDMFVDDEWAISLNGDWPGQLGFTGATNLTIVDTATTHGEGGGFAVKNFKTLTDGNYDIELNTGVTPRVLTITRVGDPVDVPVVEEDPAEWHLVGNITDPVWTVADVTFALVYSEVTESYKGSFELAANAEFKVISSDHSGWDYARGPANVETDDPVPAWLDLTGDNIKIVEAGTYDVEFFWVASIGAAINGVITIAQQDPNALPEGYTAITDILAEAEVSKVYKTRGTVVGINGGSIFIQDHTNNAINLYEAAAVADVYVALKNTLVVGDVIDAEGTFKFYSFAAELDLAKLTLVTASEGAPLSMAQVIADAATLTSRMGTDESLSGQLVRLNGVTVGPVGTPGANKYVITFGATTVVGYTFFWGNDQANRDSVNAMITTLNTNATTFDVVGVLYSSSNSVEGTWSLGICSLDYIITPAT